MRIEELINLIKKGKVSGISSDSKRIKRGFVFVAVKGAKKDGSKFIDEALAKGAKFIVCDSKDGPGRANPEVFIRVNNTRLALGNLAASFYKNPSVKTKVIGVTGTNGKTTVTYLLEALLKEAGLSPAVIGTVNYRFKGVVKPAKNTTPGSLELQSMLSEMVKRGIDYVVMEASSHALEQDRVGRIDFHSAIFTNLAQDHLDYHKTLANYFQAKAKLFKGISPGSFVVINNDDKHSSKLKKITPAKIITYGINKKADVTARDIRFGPGYTEFNLCLRRSKTRLKTKLIGRHNVYNMLAASAWAIKEGLSLEIIRSAFEKFSSVPGRLERIDSEKGGFCVFVDYAHTEDALKEALGALRQLSPERIITVFGCGGERDKLKRPKMGKVVSRLSDFAIVTSDNPRSEDPSDIARDIKKGILNDNYCVILDRQKAIREALSMAKPGDIVLLAGKGHENCQVLKDKIVHFNDREEAEACLMSLNY
ncbi:MAG: UDP-N-acetylmuramoyl-L-alanyl-D-glutamate--2,6-diaminopimelate ligase [Candidatus Omnitrophota bacterium]